MATWGMKKTIGFISIVILLGVFGYAVYFIYSNTSLLRSGLTNDQLADNNFNTVDSTNTVAVQNDNMEVAADYFNLPPQVLSVPEQYKIGTFEQELILNVPEGFTVSLFVAGLDEPRFIDFDQENNMIVADKGAGVIYLLKDNDRDGIADQKIVIDEGLRVAHSVFYYQRDLYAAEENKISVYRELQTDGTYSDRQVLVSDLPADGGHSTRTVIIGPDEKMYVSVGSSCNVCEETDGRRAAIMRYDLDGSNGEVFASGLRNTVGIEFFNGQLWGVNNGRDRIGDDIPQEEVNIIKQGKHYGWPYCYADGVVNPEYEGERESFCANETAFPKYLMQAHSAPLGLEFMDTAQDSMNFPPAFKDNLFIGFHGSWNRTVPTGYKVVRIDTTSNTNQVINFITGWLQEDGTAWGRPVDVEFDNQGMLFITDDKAGAIYRVEYRG